MFNNTLKSLIVSFILLINFTSFSYADFFVIPVLKNMKNVVTVAKSGGQFTDVQSALDSIGTKATETNPYLVFVGPGEYAVLSTITMKPFVNIQGSGEGITILKGSISSSLDTTSAIISGSDNATLGYMSIVNEGTNYNTGIFNDSASPMLRNITAMGYNHGVYNENSSPIMTNVTATGRSCGVCNMNNSSSTMTNVTTKSTIQGIYNYNSSPIIRNSIIQGDIYSLYGGTASFSTLIGGPCIEAICNTCVDENSVSVTCTPPP